MAYEDLIKDDIVSMFRGELIGSGISRDVYAFDSMIPKAKRLVMKIEREDSGHFANVLEYKIWCIVRKTKWAKWFAPCVALSESGRILMQARTEPVSESSQWPDEMPAFLGDTKVNNYGVYKGRVVCHDYGLDSVLAMIFNGKGPKMKSVEWMVPNG